jgi:hypothetical protein
MEREFVDLGGHAARDRPTLPVGGGAPAGSDTQLEEGISMTLDRLDDLLAELGR